MGREDKLADGKPVGFEERIEEAKCTGWVLHNFRFHVDLSKEARDKCVQASIRRRQTEEGLLRMQQQIRSEPSAAAKDSAVAYNKAAGKRPITGVCRDRSSPVRAPARDADAE